MLGPSGETGEVVANLSAGSFREDTGIFVANHCFESRLGMGLQIGKLTQCPATTVLFPTMPFLAGLSKTMRDVVEVVLESMGNHPGHILSQLGMVVFEGQ